MGVLLIYVFCDLVICHNSPKSPDLSKHKRIRSELYSNGISRKYQNSFFNLLIYSLLSCIFSSPNSSLRYSTSPSISSRI